MLSQHSGWFGYSASCPESIIAAAAAAHQCLCMDSAVGLYVFQVMHHAALTPARVHAGLRLNGQEMRETAQSGLSEDRW